MTLICNKRFHKNSKLISILNYKKCMQSVGAKPRFYIKLKKEDNLYSGLIINVGYIYISISRLRKDGNDVKF